MTLTDLKTFARAFSLDMLLEPLKEAFSWYESRYGLPDTVPNHLLFVPRLLETSTQQLAALLCLLDLTEHEKDIFWIAKFYYCLPLAPGWTVSRDTLDSETYRYEEKTCSFHPSIAYVAGLAAHHLNRAITSPYIPRIIIRKNEQHFVKQGAHCHTQVLLDENLAATDARQRPIWDTKVVGENLFENFVQLRSRAVSKTGLVKRQLLLNLLTRRVVVKTVQQEPRKIPNFFVSDGKKVLNPTSILRLRHLNNNFMNQNDSNVGNCGPGSLRLEVPTGLCDAATRSIPIKSLQLPLPKMENKRGNKETPVSKLTKTNILNTKKIKVIHRRESSDRNDNSSGSSSICPPQTKRPMSDFNVRGRASHINPKQFYLNMCTNASQTSMKLSTLWNAINQRALYETKASDAGGKIYQPGATLLSFKLKAK